VLLGCAAAVQVLASIAHWAWLGIDHWQSANRWQALVTASGIGGDAASTPDAAAHAIARKLAEVHHARRTLAGDDALPLLTRASPALQGMPAGTVKRMVYADGHWTLELAGNSAASAEAFAARLRDAGLQVMTATAQDATRVRIGAEW
jgi:hypothetical protein